MQKSNSHKISRIKFYVMDIKWIKRMIIQFRIRSLWFKRLCIRFGWIYTDWYKI